MVRPVSDGVQILLRDKDSLLDRLRAHATGTKEPIRELPTPALDRVTPRIVVCESFSALLQKPAGTESFLLTEALLARDRDTPAPSGPVARLVRATGRLSQPRERHQTEPIPREP